MAPCEPGLSGAILNTLSFFGATSLYGGALCIGGRTVFGLGVLLIETASSYEGSAARVLSYDKPRRFAMHSGVAVLRSVSVALVTRLMAAAISASRLL